MSKNTTAMLALSLITLFVLPADVMAGHFGLFRRCRAKPKCCQASPSATIVEAATVMPKGEAPSVLTTYECYAVFEGYDDDGEPCNFTGATMTGTDCEQVTIDAYTDVEQTAEAQGCYESFIEVHCSPDCEERGMRTFFYKVTYKICCCNGVTIERPFYSKSLEYAKRLAKRLACDRAAQKCNGRIRSCRWEICRVPRPISAPAQAQCCQ